MARFFVDSQSLEKDFIVLTGENAVHAKVLRLKAGESVVICDGSGNECKCTVSDVSPDQISLVVNSRMASSAEPKISVSVYMAFSKGDKFEHVIQKATELGAMEIVAFPSARCVSRPDEKSLKKKLERWQKIAAAASEQSGRGIVPDVLVLNSFNEAITRAAATDVPILFYENERAITLQMKLKEKPYHTVSILTGPEGGLEEKEVQQAMSAGLSVCNLGTRILRCETAPLCALSAIMYDSGEF
ncbi:MAG: 16S rRNA (uracil(1498)-N(3))-methyltransferase [Oscillospiraceae bacterium]|nr:16S rRNA (uracil(1498)-N(3))-methyltransferase [Oscillospiraceae bacterium]